VRGVSMRCREYSVHVRICANRVVAGARCSTLLPSRRPAGTHQITSALGFGKLEGLAVAIPWRFEDSLSRSAVVLRTRPRGVESSLPHHLWIQSVATKEDAKRATSYLRAPRP
jgi:hypothetical protein